MEQTYMTELNILKVRHLENINIPLSRTQRKNLILTGKNGSGKTSVLEAFVNHLSFIISNNFQLKSDVEDMIAYNTRELKNLSDKEADLLKKEEHKRNLARWETKLEEWTTGAIGKYTSVAGLRSKYNEGNFILAYYGDKRNLSVKTSRNIENIELQPVYNLESHPGRDFVKYLVNLKTKQAFAQTENKVEQANEIKAWFERFQNILRDLFDEEDLVLDFNINSFEFKILLNGREPFNFNSMSMGYSAVFDIICDLIMRMESKNSYNLEGIVLIDEIETHLHVELQRKIMPILMKLFPNLQFILTTHSPFILNSVENAVVYDLENNSLVEDGLSDYTYNGIVEGYFEADALSYKLRESFERYCDLAKQEYISDEDYAEISELEIYLDEIPDYLALDFMAEYKRLKLELSRREDTK